MEYTFNQYLDEKIGEKEGIHIISIGPGCNNSISYETNILCYEELLGVIGVILSNTIREFDLVLIDPVLPQISDTSKISKILDYLKSYYLMDNYKIVKNKKRLECYICQGDIRNHILVNIYLFNESLPINISSLHKGGVGEKVVNKWSKKLKRLIDLKRDNYGCVIVQNFVRFRLPTEMLHKSEFILNLIWKILFQEVFDSKSFSNHKLLLRWTGYFIDMERPTSNSIPPFFLFERFMYIPNDSPEQEDEIMQLKNFNPLNHFIQKLNFQITLKNNIFIPYTYNLVAENLYSIPSINSYDSDPGLDNRIYLRAHLTEIIDQVIERDSNKTKKSKLLNNLVDTSFQTYQINIEGKISLTPLFDNLEIPKEYTHLVKCQFDSDTNSESEGESERDDDSESSGYWYGKY